MIRGIYTAASGMASQMRAQDISANNLANVNTTGYKKDVPALAAFPELFLQRFNDGAPGVLGIRPWPVPLGTLGTGVWVEEVATDMKQGSLGKRANWICPPETGSLSSLLRGKAVHPQRQF